MSDPGAQERARFSHSRPLSVVMPVHNAGPYLDKAVTSILAQTFADFEFVILNDASTDGSGEQLRSWQERDPRIRLIEAQQNLGPVESSNLVARAAKTPLVARMDADDISHPERLASQVDLLSQWPNVGLVASLCDIVDASGKMRREAEVWRLARPSPFVPFAHGSIMYRRQLFDQLGGYRKQCEYWEDYDLIVRTSEITDVAIIPRSLYRVRQSGASTRVASLANRTERALDSFYRMTDQLARGGDKDPSRDPPPPISRKVDPRVFIAAGSLRLWAGGRPRLVCKTISRARLGWNALSAATLIWALWASLSPSSLRAFLLLLLRMRNRSAHRQVRTDRPLLWRPMQQVEPLPSLKVKQ